MAMKQNEHFYHFFLQINVTILNLTLPFPIGEMPFVDILHSDGTSADIIRSYPTTAQENKSFALKSSYGNK